MITLSHFLRLLFVQFTLSWNPSPGPDVAGYKLHYGPSPNDYRNVIDVGNVTTFPVSDLPGGTYFFVATAYSSYGVEGPASNETSVTVTGPTPSPWPVPTISPAPTVSPTPGGTPGIGISPNPLVFTAIVGQSIPAKAITITTSNGAPWTAHDVSVRFNAQPQAGGPSGTDITVTPNTGLPAGTYSDPITFSAAGLPSRDGIVSITITSTAPTVSPSPFRTATPIPTATASPTISPMPTATPTLTPTPFPTASVTPSPVTTPSPSPGVLQINAPVTTTIAAHGYTVTFSATIKRPTGFTAPVSWTSSGLPAGVSATFTPNPLLLNKASVKIVINDCLPRGSYLFQLRAVGGNQDASATVTLEKK